MEMFAIRYHGPGPSATYTGSGATWSRVMITRLQHFINICVNVLIDRNFVCFISHLENNGEGRNKGMSYFIMLQNLTYS